MNSMIKSISLILVLSQFTSHEITINLGSYKKRDSKQELKLTINVAERENIPYGSGSACVYKTKSLKCGKVGYNEDMKLRIELYLMIECTFPDKPKKEPKSYQKIEYLSLSLNELKGLVKEEIMKTKEFFDLIIISLNENKEIDIADFSAFTLIVSNDIKKKEHIL